MNNNNKGGGGGGWISAFSEQLNQIKDVITTDAYTKDDDDDYNSDRYQDDDDEAVMLRTENLKLRNENKEIEKRLLEFEEREVNISREFRVILSEKEQEIKNLKSANSNTSNNSNNEELQKLKLDYDTVKESNNKLNMEKEQLNVIISNLKKNLEVTSNVNTNPTTTLPTTLPTTSNNTDSEEVEKLKEQLNKAQKDLARLRQHLIDVEDQHTLTDLENSETIEKLKEDISKSQVQIESFKQKSEQLDKVQKELSIKVDENRNKDQELMKANTTITNLNNVLEQFQQEQELTIQRELVNLNQQLSNAQKELENLRKQSLELKELKVQFYNTLDHVKQLEISIMNKDADYQRLKADIEPLKVAFDKNILRLGDMCLQEQESVDKRVVSKLILTYLSKTTTSTKKNEILHLIAKILNFGDKEKSDIGLIKSHQWSLIPTFFSGANQDINNNNAGEKPITEMWIEFLLKESSVEIDDSNNNSTNDQQQQQYSSTTPFNTPIKSPTTPNISTPVKSPIIMNPQHSNFYNVTPNTKGKTKTTIILDGDTEDPPFK